MTGSVNGKAAFSALRFINEFSFGKIRCTDRALKYSTVQMVFQDVVELASAPFHFSQNQVDFYRVILPVFSGNASGHGRTDQKPRFRVEQLEIKETPLGMVSLAGNNGSPNRNAQFVRHFFRIDSILISIRSLLFL